MSCDANNSVVECDRKSSMHPSECLVIRRHRLTSRFFLAPVNTGYAVDGLPSQQFVDFYVARSGKNIGIAYVGNTAIDKEFVTNSGTACMSAEHPRWTDLASSIHRAGSLPGVQIGARRSSKVPLKQWKTASIQDVVNHARSEIKSMSVDSIESMRDAFIRSAVTAFTSGFSVVQLHGAHGYFLARMMDPRINRRDDQYNANELKLLRDIVDEIRNQAPDIVLDLRLSISEGIEERSIEIAKKMRLIDKLVGLNVDMVSLSDGFYDIDKSLIYPDKSQPHGLNIPFASVLADRHSHKIWNIAGNIYDVAQISGTLPINLTFSIGRSLIADPYFVEKSLSGRSGEIIACCREQCCHYYSSGKPMLSCVMNDALSD